MRGKGLLKYFDASLKMLLAITLLVCWDSASYAASGDIKQIENKDRDVDMAALDSMNLAVKSLVTLYQKRKDTPEEPDVLIKLIELLQKVSAVEFRIAQGRTGNINQWKTTLRETIKYVNRLIERYPNHHFVPKAILVRARTFKDLGEKQLAEKDFVYLNQKYPNHDMAALGLLHLCDLLMEAREYPRAVGYLKILEAKPNRPFYSMVLDHLAWAHYYMNDLPMALRYNEARVAYHERLLAKKKGDASELEVSGMNATLFYAKAIERKMPGYTVVGAGPYFRKIVRGPKLGKMFYRFSQHLRTSDLHNELEDWTNIMIREYPTRPETMEIFFVTMENQVNQRRYAQMRVSIGQLHGLIRQNPTMDKDGAVTAKLRGHLTNAAAALQQNLAQRKEDEDRAPYIPLLLEVYGEILRVSAQADSTLAKVHFNLAELNFEMKRFEVAEKHYRWVVKNASTKEKVDAALIPKASFNSISCRYEVLRGRGVIPKELKAVSVDLAKKGALSPQLIEWLEWLKEHQGLKTGDSLEVFLFESNRAIYAAGHIDDALVRLSLFAERLPKSEYTIPSLSLILDTLIASSRWEKAYEMSKKFLDSNHFKGTEFHKRLFTIASDVYFKLIEQAYKAQDYQLALSRADEFLKFYPSSPRVTETQVIAANAALGLKDKKRALAHFSKVEDSKSPDIAGPALLTKASVAEELFNYDAASNELYGYIERFGRKGAINQQELDSMRRKTLYLAVLSGSRVTVEKTMMSGMICTKSIEEYCDQMRAVWELMHPSKGRDETSLKGYRRSRNAPVANRAIWATVALENRRAFQLHERLDLVDTVISGWAAQSPIIKYTLLPYISVSLPSSFEIARNEVKRAAPLKIITKGRIDKRVGMIKTLEEVGAKITQLPWVRVRAAVLNEVASLYADFAAEINAIPAPDGLKGPDLAEYKNTIKEITSPFMLKVNEYRKQAFELASAAAIEDSEFSEISFAYFKENPAISAEMKRNWALPKLKPITAMHLRKADPAGNWVDTPPRGDDRALHFKYRLFKALERKNWPQIAFLLQEGKDQDLTSKGLFQLAKGISMAIAGARAEGLLEIEQCVAELGKEQKKEVLFVLASHYYYSFAKEKTKIWVEKYLDNDSVRPPEDDVRVLANAAKWSGLESSDERVRL